MWRDLRDCDAIRESRHISELLVRWDRAMRLSRRLHGDVLLCLLSSSALRFTSFCPQPLHAVKRRLARLHWDNCKVRFDEAVGVSFAAAALTAGFLEADIITARQHFQSQRSFS